MSQMKIIKLTNCSLCPSFMKIDGERFCMAVNKYIEREEVYVLEDDSIVDNRFPDWCPLEDC